MEKEGAVTMFLRSIEKHAIKYTTFVGDSDTSSFAAVTKHYQNSLMIILL